MRGNFLVGLAGRAGIWGRAVDVQKLVGQGFVVHDQQAPLGAGGIATGAGRVQAKVLHAVVVVTRAVVKVGITAVIFVGRCGRVQRIAQGVDSPGGIP